MNPSKPRSLQGSLVKLQVGPFKGLSKAFERPFKGLLKAFKRRSRSYKALKGLEPLRPSGP